MDIMDIMDIMDSWFGQHVDLHEAFYFGTIETKVALSDVFK